jgi:hypothetical protein
MENLASLAQLLLIPAVGLLWRISGQLAELSATVKAHDHRLTMLERAPQ